MTEEERREELLYWADEQFSSFPRLLCSLLPSQESSYFLFSRGSIEPVEEKIDGPIEPVLLQEVLKRVVDKYSQLIKERPLLVPRQRFLLSDVLEVSRVVNSEMQNEAIDLGVLSFYINDLGEKVDALLGVTTSRDILAHVFDNFCIGK